MSLRHSYTVIAPLYDALLAGAGTGVRAASLAQLPQEGGLHILISGIGSGWICPTFRRATITWGWTSPAPC